MSIDVLTLFFRLYRYGDTQKTKQKQTKLHPKKVHIQLSYSICGLLRVALQDEWKDVGKRCSGTLIRNKGRGALSFNRVLSSPQSPFRVCVCVCVCVVLQDQMQGSSAAHFKTPWPLTCKFAPWSLIRCISHCASLL